MGDAYGEIAPNPRGFRVGQIVSGGMLALAYPARDPDEAAGDDDDALRCRAVDGGGDAGIGQSRCLDLFGRRAGRDPAERDAAGRSSRWRPHRSS